MFRWWQAEATAAAEAARGTETAAAMTLMRAAVAAEVEAARERQLEAAEAAGAARPSEAEETDSQREAMRAAVAVKVRRVILRTILPDFLTATNNMAFIDEKHLTRQNLLPPPPPSCFLPPCY